VNSIEAKVVKLQLQLEKEAGEVVLILRCLFLG
jgi:hypothetical protein